MSDTFQLQGSYTVTPLSPPASADFGITATLSEALTLLQKSADSFDLTADAAFVVPLNGLSQAHVVIVKVTAGPKVDAVVTTADGTSQVVPVDSLLVLISRASPVTAISLTRTPATLSSVRVFLGQSA